ncbi:MAG TPA: hypothetical protein VFU50_16375 [Terriglobales bacterium]|nr:hypothetical protein [Terriglobales bacterium]
MKSSIHRAIATLVMGLIFGWYNHHEYLRWNQRGRDAFISHEQQRFNSFMVHPHSVMFTIANAIVGSAVVFVFYELIVIALSRLFPAQQTVR